MVPILEGLFFFFGIATALGRVMSGRVDALAMQERSNQTQRVEYYRGGGITDQGSSATPPL